MMSDGGFNLRSWASNSPAISSLAAKDNVLESSTNVKVLGMLWKPTTDHMTFLEHFIPATDQQTKREVLSEASKIYDSLGLLFQLKIFYFIFQPPSPSEPRY